ncbi:protein FAM136A-like protein [Dinothrombium tinctorium]|uniref:Protein FAM136A-like protein n=1 Tax=Dinothrombium tinctorium TaxID=1965070 RepID=A0A443RA39_9ACAR|nr:protein FAM136A-like protein [Dinothrombium tinctorium]
MNAAQSRVQDGIQKLVEDLDKDCLRKMQAQMHRCAAECCEKPSLSINDAQTCITRCSEPLSKAQNYVQYELNRYQSRLERCVHQCQDSIKDKITPNASQQEMDAFKKQFEQCALKCVDTNIDLIPNLFKKMREVIKSGKYENQLV